MTPTDEEWDQIERELDERAAAIDAKFPSEYRTRYYDRDGKPMSMGRWSRLHSDFKYKIVQQTYVGAYYVSTVWLGLDHSFSPGGPPIIFETMVFSSDEFDDKDRRGLSDFDCVRYSTEAEALAGHADMVTLVRATAVQPDGTDPTPRDVSLEDDD